MLRRGRKQRDYVVHMMGSGLRPPGESRGFSNAWTIQYVLFDNESRRAASTRKRARRTDSVELPPRGSCQRLARALRNLLLRLIGDLK